MTQTKASEFETFDPGPKILEKARDILKQYHPVLETSKDEFFGSFSDLPGVLAYANSKDECMRRLFFLGETYIASALTNELSLPKAADQ